MSQVAVKSVLFVCAGNTCRSVLAESLAKRRFGNSLVVSSAGLRPQKAEDAQEAIDTLNFDFGIDAAGHAPRDVRNVDLQTFDAVVAMDKHIAKELRSITQRDIVVWDIDDPWETGPYQYRRCALQIGQKLSTLLVNDEVTRS
jgi:protein-tyrosine-phosphatase